MRHQTGLNPFLNDFVYALAVKIFPDAVAEHAVPALIALPLGVHASENWDGYFEREQNMIVMFEQYGKVVLQDAQREVIKTGMILFLIHELSHWYAWRMLREEKTIELAEEEDHRHYSWSHVCYLVTSRLFGDIYDLTFFQPEMTIQDGHGKTRKVRRQGSLSWQDLRNFPHRRIPEFYTHLDDVLALENVSV